MTTSTSPALVAAPVSSPSARATAPPSAGGAVGAWSRWQCIAFRYALCHFLLYALPSPIAGGLETLGNGIEWLGKKIGEPALLAEPFTWPGAASKWLSHEDWDKMDFGWFDSAWQTVTTWMWNMGLAPYEVIHQGTGSGDTGAAFARLLCIVVVSALVTAVWSLSAGHSRGYPRAGRWLHLFARWFVGLTVLGYGLEKLYGGQFGQLGWSRLTQEIGETMPMTMVGTFMKASKPYELFGGVGEVLGGLLLLHHRTSLLGAIVTIGVMANVCALNWLYGVPVKQFSLHLLLIAVALLAPYAGRLWALLISNRPSSPVDIRVVRRAWLAWPLALFGWVWIGCHLVDWHFGLLRASENSAKMRGPEPELSGVWSVERMTIDGVDVPPTDATRWRFLVVVRGPRVAQESLRGPRLSARELTGREYKFQCTERLAENKLILKPIGQGAEETWTIERGKAMAKERNPVPLRQADREKTVEVERRTLVCKGTWAGKQIEVHTIEKVFPLQTGFRLRQELPDGW